MTELCDLGAVEMRRLIGAKRISPVELLESCLARIEALSPRLNAIVALAAERARAEAKAAEAAVMCGDSLPLFHGLPIGIKDMQETEGRRWSGRWKMGLQTLPTNRLVRNTITLANAPLHEAVKMASLTPARILNIFHKTGSLSVGLAADLVLFNEDIDLKLTMIDGKIVFEK